MDAFRERESLIEPTPKVVHSPLTCETLAGPAGTTATRSLSCAVMCIYLCAMLRRTNTSSTPQQGSDFGGIVPMHVLAPAR